MANLAVRECYLVPEEDIETLHRFFITKRIIPSIHESLMIPHVYFCGNLLVAKGYQDSLPTDFTVIDEINWEKELSCGDVVKELRAWRFLSTIKPAVKEVLSAGA